MIMLALESVTISVNVPVSLPSSTVHLVYYDLPHNVIYYVLFVMSYWLRVICYVLFVTCYIMFYCMLFNMLLTGVDRLVGPVPTKPNNFGTTPLPSSKYYLYL